MKVEKIEMRVTPEFKSKVRASAQAANLSVTAYLMTAALEKMYGQIQTNRGSANAAKTHEHS